MKNKKIIAVVAGLAALTVVGGSFAAYAAESGATSKAGYSYTIGQTNGAKNADTDEQTNKTDYSYVVGQENGSQYADAEGAPDDADKTDFSFNVGKEGREQRTSKVENEIEEDNEIESESPEDAEIERTEDTEVKNEKSEETETERDRTEETEIESEKSEDSEVEKDKPEDDADRSYNAGQQNAQSRNSVYEDLPEGGTKEDAETFYKQNDVGGGAWVNGAYDESTKNDYGYVQGQQRGSSYAQETDGEVTPDKSGYSYSSGRQSYEQNHATWTWGE